MGKFKQQKFDESKSLKSKYNHRKQALKSAIKNEPSISNKLKINHKQKELPHQSQDKISNQSISNESFDISKWEDEIHSSMKKTKNGVFIKKKIDFVAKRRKRSFIDKFRENDLALQTSCFDLSKVTNVKSPSKKQGELSQEKQKGSPVDKQINSSKRKLKFKNQYNAIKNAGFSKESNGDKLCDETISQRTEDTPISNLVIEPSQFTLTQRCYVGGIIESSQLTQETSKENIETFDSLLPEQIPKSTQSIENSSPPHFEKTALENQIDISNFELSPEHSQSRDDVQPLLSQFPYFKHDAFSNKSCAEYSQPVDKMLNSSPGFSQSKDYSPECSKSKRNFNTKDYLLKVAKIKNPSPQGSKSKDHSPGNSSSQNSSNAKSKGNTPDVKGPDLSSHDFRSKLSSPEVSKSKKLSPNPSEPNDLSSHGSEYAKPKGNSFEVQISMDKPSQISKTKDRSSEVSESHHQASKVHKSKAQLPEVSKQNDHSSECSTSKNLSSKLSMSKYQASAVSKSKEQSSEDSKSNDQMSKVSNSKALSSKFRKSKDQPSEVSKPKDQPSEVSQSKNQSSNVSKEKDSTAKDSKSKFQPSQLFHSKCQSCEIFQLKNQSSEIPKLKDQTSEVFKSKSSKQEEQSAEVSKSIASKPEEQSAEVSKSIASKSENQSAKVSKSKASKPEDQSAEVSKSIASKSEDQSAEVSKSIASKPEERSAEVSKLIASKSENQSAKVSKSKASKPEDQSAGVSKSIASKSEDQSFEVSKSDHSFEVSISKASKSDQSAEVSKSKASESDQSAEVSKSKASKSADQSIEVSKSEDRTASQSKHQSCEIFQSKDQSAKFPKSNDPPTEVSKSKDQFSELSKSNNHSTEVLKSCDLSSATKNHSPSHSRSKAQLSGVLSEISQSNVVPSEVSKCKDPPNVAKSQDCFPCHSQSEDLFKNTQEVNKGCLSQSDNPQLPTHHSQSRQNLFANENILCLGGSSQIGDNLSQLTYNSHPTYGTPPPKECEMLSQSSQIPKPKHLDGSSQIEENLSQLTYNSHPTYGKPPSKECELLSQSSQIPKPKHLQERFKASSNNNKKKSQLISCNKNNKNNLLLLDEKDTFSGDNQSIYSPASMDLTDCEVDKLDNHKPSQNSENLDHKLSDKSVIAGKEASSFQTLLSQPLLTQDLLNRNSETLIDLTADNSGDETFSQSQIIPSSQSTSSPNLTLSSALLARPSVKDKLFDISQSATRKDKINKEKFSKLQTDKIIISDNDGVLLSNFTTPKKLKKMSKKQKTISPLYSQPLFSEDRNENQNPPDFDGVMNNNQALKTSPTSAEVMTEHNYSKNLNRKRKGVSPCSHSLEKTKGKLEEANGPKNVKKFKRKSQNDPQNKGKRTTNIHFNDWMDLSKQLSPPPIGSPVIATNKLKQNEIGQYLVRASPKNKPRQNGSSVKRTCDKREIPIRCPSDETIKDPLSLDDNNQNDQLSISDSEQSILSYESKDTPTQLLSREKVVLLSPAQLAKILPDVGCELSTQTKLKTKTNTKRKKVEKIKTVNADTNSDEKHSTKSKKLKLSRKSIKNTLMNDKEIEKTGDESSTNTKKTEIMEQNLQNKTEELPLIKTKNKHKKIRSLKKKEIGTNSSEVQSEGKSDSEQPRQLEIHNIENKSEENTIKENPKILSDNMTQENKSENLETTNLREENGTVNQINKSSFKKLSTDKICESNGFNDECDLMENGAIETSENSDRLLQNVTDLNEQMDFIEKLETQQKNKKLPRSIEQSDREVAETNSTEGPDSSKTIGDCNINGSTIGNLGSTEGNSEIVQREENPSKADDSNEIIEGTQKSQPVSSLNLCNSVTLEQSDKTISENNRVEDSSAENTEMNFSPKSNIADEPSEKNDLESELKIQYPKKSRTTPRKSRTTLRKSTKKIRSLKKKEIGTNSSEVQSGGKGDSEQPRQLEIHNIENKSEENTINENPKIVSDNMTQENKSENLETNVREENDTVNQINKSSFKKLSTDKICESNGFKDECNLMENGATETSKKSDRLLQNVTDLNEQMDLIEKLETQQKNKKLPRSIEQSDREVAETNSTEGPDSCKTIEDCNTEGSTIGNLESIEGNSEIVQREENPSKADDSCEIIEGTQKSQPLSSLNLCNSVTLEQSDKTMSENNRVDDSSAENTEMNFSPKTNIADEYSEKNDLSELKKQDPKKSRPRKSRTTPRKSRTSPRKNTKTPKKLENQEHSDELTPNKAPVDELKEKLINILVTIDSFESSQKLKNVRKKATSKSKFERKTAAGTRQSPRLNRKSTSDDSGNSSNSNQSFEDQLTENVATNASSENAHSRLKTKLEVSNGIQDKCSKSNSNKNTLPLVNEINTKKYFGYGNDDFEPNNFCVVDPPKTSGDYQMSNGSNINESGEEVETSQTTTRKINPDNDDFETDNFCVVDPPKSSDDNQISNELNISESDEEVETSQTTTRKINPDNAIQKSLEKQRLQRKNNKTKHKKHPSSEEEMPGIVEKETSKSKREKSQRKKNESIDSQVENQKESLEEEYSVPDDVEKSSSEITKGNPREAKNKECSSEKEIHEIVEEETTSKSKRKRMKLPRKKDNFKSSNIESLKDFASGDNISPGDAEEFVSQNNMENPRETNEKAKHKKHPSSEEEMPEIVEKGTTSKSKRKREKSQRIKIDSIDTKSPRKKNKSNERSAKNKEDSSEVGNISSDVEEETTSKSKKKKKSKEKNHKSEDVENVKEENGTNDDVEESTSRRTRSRGSKNKETSSVTQAEIPENCNEVEYTPSTSSRKMKQLTLVNWKKTRDTVTRNEATDSISHEDNFSELDETSARISKIFNSSPKKLANEKRTQNDCLMEVEEIDSVNENLSQPIRKLRSAKKEPSVHNSTKSNMETDRFDKSYDSKSRQVDQFLDSFHVSEDEMLNIMQEEFFRLMEIDPESKQKLENLDIKIDWPVPILHETMSENFTPKVKRQLNIDVEFDDGAFSEEEDEIILKNWKRFCKKYAFDRKEDVRLFLPYVHSMFHPLSRSKKIDFLKFLAQNLPKRPLGLVYNRFVRLKRCCKKGPFSEEEDAVIFYCYKNIPKMYAVASIILNRPRSNIYQRWKLIQKRFLRTGVTESTENSSTPRRKASNETPKSRKLDEANARVNKILDFFPKSVVKNTKLDNEKSPKNDSKEDEEIGEDENEIQLICRPSRRCRSSVEEPLIHGSGNSGMKIDENDDDTFHYIDEFLKSFDVSEDEMSKIVRKHVLKLIKIDPESKQKLSDLDIKIDWPLSILHQATTESFESEDRRQLNDVRYCLGEFSEEEDETVLENWKQFCKKYGFHRKKDVKLFLPYIHKRYNPIPNHQKLNFIRFLAQNLPKRPLDLVYNRFVKMKQCYTKGTFSEEEDAVVLHCCKNVPQNKRYAVAGLILNRHRRNIYIHVRKLLSKRFPELSTMVKTVASNNEDQKVSWQSFLSYFNENYDLGNPDENKKLFDEESLKKLSSHFSVDQTVATYLCHTKIWPKICSTKPFQKKSLDFEILSRLKGKSDDWEDVDWIELSKDLHNVGPVHLYSKLRKLVEKHVQPEYWENLKDCIDVLYDKIAPEESDNLANGNQYYR